MERIEAEHPRPRHFLLHLSDPHLLGGPQPLHGVVDSEALLRQLFEEVRASGARPEAVIFTGDLADPASRRRTPGSARSWSPRAGMGAEVFWAMGNHDDRAYFRAGLLVQADNDAPLDHSYDVDGLRIVSLDTTVPGFHHGELSDAQLSWLTAELATPAPHGTLLALHHPPVPSVLARPRSVELRGQSRSPTCCGHRRPRHPGRPPALLDVRHFRGHSGVGRLGDLLHPGSERACGRHPRPRRRAGVQPGPRLRTHDRAFRGVARRHPRSRRACLSRGSPAPALGRRDLYPGQAKLEAPARTPAHRRFTTLN